MMVWSADPETGETALRCVVQAFVRETGELTHVTIADEAGNTETITCTPEHPFYVEGRGWIGAGVLHRGMKVRFASGASGIAGDVLCEELQKPVAVYNFEVETCHTYFMGEFSILVHNICGSRNTPDQDAVIKLAKEAKKNGGVDAEDANTLVDWAKEYGINSHYPTVHEGRSGMWSEVEHINVFKIHIPVVK